MIAGEYQKNEENRIVVLNCIAKELVEKQRGVHKKYVFTYQGKPISCINTKSFRAARNRAEKIRPSTGKITLHSMKVTFLTRLRAAGVPEEDRKEVAGHTGDRRYSLPDLIRMHEYVERIVEPTTMVPMLRR
jgi:hypothetical protein